MPLMLNILYQKVKHFRKEKAMDGCLYVVAVLLLDFFITALAWWLLTLALTVFSITLPCTWGVCFVVWLISKCIKMLV